MTYAIDVQNLRFGYQKHAPLLHIPSWQVPRQSQTFLHGASGSGKSTLLNLLSGILSPDQGTIDLLDQPFSRLSSRKRDRFRAQHIGVVFQEFNLIPFLTVSENIDLAVTFAQSAPLDVNTRKIETLTRLRLDEKLLAHRADQLSVGQRQRVSIARALINQPEILIADEPTSALDADNRDEFIQLLLETANASQCTVLFVSHDRALQSYFQQSVSMHELTQEVA